MRTWLRQASGLRLIRTRLPKFVRNSMSGPPAFPFDVAPGLPTEVATTRPRFCCQIVSMSSSQPSKARSPECPGRVIIAPTRSIRSAAGPGRPGRQGCGGDRCREGGGLPRPHPEQNRVASEGEAVHHGSTLRRRESSRPCNPAGRTVNYGLPPRSAPRSSIIPIQSSYAGEVIVNPHKTGT